MHFDARLTLLDPVPVFPPEVLREEQSQCRVDPATAARGGPVHRAFLAALPADWRADPTVEIFSRLLWLRAGWQPLALGFHCDWGPPVTLDPPRVDTLMANFGGHSYTEFVDEAFELPDAAPGERPAWGPLVDAAVEAGRLKTCRLPAGRLAHFDDRAWHRARPAETTGFRLLIRAIRGLPPAQRYRGEDFASVRNPFTPTTPEEQARHAAYR